MGGEVHKREFDMNRFRSNKVNFDDTKNPQDVHKIYVYK